MNNNRNRDSSFAELIKLSKDINLKDIKNTKLYFLRKFKSYILELMLKNIPEISIEQLFK